MQPLPTADGAAGAATEAVPPHHADAVVVHLLSFALNRCHALLSMVSPPENLPAPVHSACMQVLASSLVGAGLPPLCAALSLFADRPRVAVGLVARVSQLLVLLDTVSGGRSNGFDDEATVARMVARAAMGDDVYEVPAGTRSPSQVQGRGRAGGVSSPVASASTDRGATTPAASTSGSDGERDGSPSTASGPQWPAELGRSLATLLGRLAAVLVRGTPPHTPRLDASLNAGSNVVPTSATAPESGLQAPTDGGESCAMQLVGLSAAVGRGVVASLQQRDVKVASGGDFLPPSFSMPASCMRRRTMRSNSRMRSKRVSMACASSSLDSK